MVSLFELSVGIFFQSVAAILAILGGWVTYLTYKRGTKVRALEAQVDRLKRQNLRISSSVNPESERTLIKDAEKTIEILDINALGPLHHSREALIEFLKKNEGTLRILLLDPEGEKFQERADKEGDVDGRILSEWRASIGILRGISRRAQRRGTIDFRLYNLRPKVSLIIADGLEEEGQMLINYYPAELGTRGYKAPQFLAQGSLIRDRDSFKKNLDHFNELWENATVEDIYQLDID